MNGAVVTAAHGKTRVASVEVARVCERAGRREASATLACDLVAMSGGWSPVLHLFAQSGGKAHWHDEKACFVPGKAMQAESSVGACAGEFTLARGIRFAVDAGVDAARAAGFIVARPNPVQVAEITEAPMQPLWLVGGPRTGDARAEAVRRLPERRRRRPIFSSPRAKAIDSVEHVKRYTAMGFGTDQGKLGNINGMAILAQALGKTIPETGTTTFRPNYTPVTFGTIAGPRTRRVPRSGAQDGGARMARRERRGVRGCRQLEASVVLPEGGRGPARGSRARMRSRCATSVGILDASTLGKIDIQGPDAATLLELGLHESVEQAGSRQVPLRPDARRERHDLRRRRDRAPRRPALHDDDHHRRRGARADVARTLAADRMAATCACGSHR